jgi:PAS domain S-box-containing protein
VARQLGSVIQRKRSEEALRLSEERFRLTFNYAPIGMMIKSLDEKSLQVNQAICNILGYSHTELLNLASGEITHPEDLANSLEMRSRILSGEFSSYQISIRYISKQQL